VSIDEISNEKLVHKWCLLGSTYFAILSLSIAKTLECHICDELLTVRHNTDRICSLQLFSTKYFSAHIGELFSCSTCKIIMYFVKTLCLQCFDMVGHPACKNWMMRYGMVFGLEWGAYGPAGAIATPSSLAAVKSRMAYLSGAGLPRLSWKKGRWMDVVVVVVRTCYQLRWLIIILKAQYNLYCVKVPLNLHPPSGWCCDLWLCTVMCDAVGNLWMFFLTFYHFPATFISFGWMGCIEHTVCMYCSRLTLLSLWTYILLLWV